MSPELPAAIPDHLRGRAILPDGNPLEEAVWSPADALALLDALSGGSLGIEGGQVCRREPWGGWVITSESWDCLPNPGEDPLGFAQRSRDEAAAFIETWSEDHGESVHFALRFV
jgi:hypothetical protein